MIKSYTDINQSKKLAKILPLESADMCINSTNPYMIFTEVRPMEGFDDEHDPAWSLAALLSVLPDYSLQSNPNGTVFVVSDFKKPMMSDDYDNPVDACVTMIEKLHKLNLL